MSRNEERSTEMTRNHEENGFKILQKINIIETVSNMDPRTKWVLVLYCLSVSVSFIVASYSDGKTDLFNYRTSSNYDSNREWSVVYEGCSKNNHENMISSLIFPYTVFSRIAPYLVLAFN